MLVVWRLCADEGERSVISQSQRRWSSRDAGACTSRGELVDVTRCGVVLIVCCGVSVLLLLPISAFGRPSDVGIMLTTVSVPSLPVSVLPAAGSDQWRRALTSQRASTLNNQRQLFNGDLRQIHALRHLHGSIHSHRNHLTQLNSTGRDF